MAEINEFQFFLAVKRLPVDDDMERVNCPLAGTKGHMNCGWNKVHNKPCFMVGPNQEVKEDV